MSKVWNFQAKHYGMHGAERNFSHEGNGSGCHAGGGAGQQVHLRGGLLSFRRQDQCPRGLLSTCSLQAEGNCTTTVVHILLVRHFQAHRRVVVLLLARGVGRSPFPPWGLGASWGGADIASRNPENWSRNENRRRRRKMRRMLVVSSSNHRGQWLWWSGGLRHTHGAQDTRAILVGLGNNHRMKREKGGQTNAD